MGESLSFILDIFIKKEDYAVRWLSLEILQLEEEEEEEDGKGTSVSRNLNPKINHYFSLYQGISKVPYVHGTQGQIRNSLF